MNTKVILALIVSAAIVLVGFGAWYSINHKDYSQITSYSECIAAGYPILESYPEQCRLPDGRTFVHDLSGGGDVPRSANFNEPATLLVGNKLEFPNSLSVTLIAIDDSRCKPDIQCIWQGEISALLSVKHGEDDAQEIRIGTVNNESVFFAGYSFSLERATPENVTVLVSDGSIPGTTSSGTIRGYIHTGPVCPVAQFPPDPNCADRPYANAEVIITNKANGMMNKAVSNAVGNFQATLTVGAYTIAVSPELNNPFPRCETIDMVVVSDKTVAVDISCDSGIR